MDFCTQCGRQAQPGVRFCTGCGAPLRPPGAAPTELSPRVDAPPPPLEPAPPQQIPPRPQIPPQLRTPPRQQPPPRQRTTRRPVRDGRRGWDGAPRWALPVGIVLVVFICGAVVAIVLLRSSPANRAALSSNSKPTSSSVSSPQQQPSSQPASTQPASTQPASPQPPAAQVAAQSLSQLLARSAGDRTAIVNAANDVSNCGPGLAQDAQTFQQAASSRQTLLSQLSSLPDSSALPAQMLQDLTNAWQESEQADTDLAGWANDENTNGCTSNDTSDSNYQAATQPDDEATADKKAFVNAWNSIASQYGLSTYQWDQV